MSYPAAGKPSRQLFAPGHVEILTRFKWHLPIFITVAVPIVPLIHYWTFLNTGSAKYIPVGFAIILAVFLSALPAIMCSVATFREKLDGPKAPRCVLRRQLERL